jgi:hypothetical protein
MDESIVYYLNICVLKIFKLYTFIKSVKSSQIKMEKIIIGVVIHVLD